MSSAGIAGVWVPFTCACGGEFKTTLTHVMCPECGAVTYITPPASTRDPSKEDQVIGEPRVVIYIEETSPPRPVGPCPVTNGPHRWAWLTSGGQACGYCGRPR